MTGDSTGAGPSGMPGRPGIVVGGRYVLLRVIGQGGMGTVFEAEDQRIGRRVAIKLLNRDYVQPQDAGRRFRREARAAAQIQHPNVVVVHDSGTRRDGSFFIVQELLEGVSLRDHLSENGRLSPAEALEIMVPVMGALIAAHRKGVIHRDVKPENIFLASGQLGVVVPKLIDFGIALAPDTLTARASTSRKGIVGTVAYMSPEQARDEKPDIRTDVWSAAVVLFELLHGTPPFHGTTWFAVLERLRSADRVPRISTLVDGVPSELADILERALARDREQRFPTMESFLAAVLGFVRRSMPGLAERHAASIPRYVESTPPPPNGTDGDGSDYLVPPIPSSRPPFVRMEWQIDPYAATAGGVDLVARAEDDLRINALEDALAHAAAAIDAHGARGESYGRMRLVQASAGRWLGRFAEAERWARDAMDHLARGSARWYSAFGHLALVAGYLGHNHALPALADELERFEAQGHDGCAHIKAAGRLVVSLARAGRIDLAQHVFGNAQALAAGLSMDDTEVLAWLDVANAELVLHAGDLPTGLSLLEVAVTGFVQAGAVRNACLQRCNVGNAYMGLGLYYRAEQIQRAAVLVGEPMKLNFIGPARANLGFALARLGDLEQAFEIESIALEQCVRQGNRRFEAVARIYLAEILRLRGDLAAAEAEARRAVAGAAIAPALRAYALAMLGDVLLGLGRAGDALALASEAVAIVESLGGLEEGEALIRLVHILALEATGSPAQAAAHAQAARRRLHLQASKISDPTWRRSFLENVPENARICALAGARD